MHKRDMLVVRESDSSSSSEDELDDNLYHSSSASSSEEGDDKSSSEIDVRSDSSSSSEEKNYYKLSEFSEDDDSDEDSHQQSAIEEKYSMDLAPQPKILLYSQEFILKLKLHRKFLRRKFRAYGRCRTPFGARMTIPFVNMAVVGGGFMYRRGRIKYLCSRKIKMASQLIRIYSWSARIKAWMAKVMDKLNKSLQRVIDYETKRVNDNNPSTDDEVLKLMSALSDYVYIFYLTALDAQTFMSDWKNQVKSYHDKLVKKYNNLTQYSGEVARKAVRLREPNSLGVVWKHEEKIDSNPVDPLYIGYRLERELGEYPRVVLKYD